MGVALVEAVSELLRLVIPDVLADDAPETELALEDDVDD